MSSELLQKTWRAYASARDRGHLTFIDKANRCEKFFRGDQWGDSDLEKLGDRPALTVNMVLATMATAFGQMVENYSEVSFYSKDGRYAEQAEVLRKITKHVYNENFLKWKENDMAMDGFITGRGFLDARMTFGENLRGDITIEHLDPRDVYIDPEAKSYDPEGWKEIFISKWLTLAEIETLYGKDKANKLKGRPMGSFSDIYDRVLTEDLPGIVGGKDASRSIWVPSSAHNDAIPTRYRVVERQYKKLSTQHHFLDQETGETRAIPETWDDARIERVMTTAFENGVSLSIIKRKVERIRTTIVGADVVMYDDWSPYDSFTVIPYFPYFRWGKTMGVVENLVDLQEGINKVFSQTLHIINTTANSGWKIKAGSLVNMTVEELEDRGAESGLVLETTNVNDIEKITPNSIPQGLDRISNQMAEWVKYVSGISDSMRGFDRADVAAKAIVAKQQAGAVSLAIPFESLNRTRHILARVILQMIQRFYTEPRVLRVDPVAGHEEESDTNVEINKPSPAGVLNDVTVGEYGVRIVTVPSTDRHEESQFQRAIELRKSGIPIPDWAIIEVSGLPNKKEIVDSLKKQAEAQQPQQDLEMQDKQADVQRKQAEAQVKQAQSQLLSARVQEVITTLQGANPKDINARQMVTEQSRMQREKLVRDDDFRYRKLALDTLLSQSKEKANGRPATTDTTSGNSGNGGPATTGTNTGANK